MPLLERETTTRLLLHEEERKRYIKSAQEVLSNPDRLSPYQLMQTWAILGECYKFDKNPDRSEEAFLQSLNIARSLSDRDLLSECYYALGNALFFCRAFARAIPYFQEAEPLFEALDKYEDLFFTRSQIAEAFRELDRREEERHYLDRAILIPSMLPLRKADLLERFAISLSDASHYEEAIRVFEQSLSILDSIPSRRHWPERLHKLAEIYRLAGDTRGVERTLHRLQDPLFTSNPPWLKHQ